MILLLTRKERQKFFDERRTLFQSDKEDVFIYEWNGKYVVELRCMIETSDRMYDSMKELLTDSLNRDFYTPYEFTANDNARFNVLKENYLYNYTC